MKLPKNPSYVIALTLILLAIGGGFEYRDKQALLRHNDELQGKLTSLEKEISRLRETADYHYRRGVEFQASGDLKQALSEFEIVITQYPTSNLVSAAQENLSEVRITSAAEVVAEADKAERERAEREKLEAQQGIEISYSSFYAKARGSGLPPGQRYRFTAEVSQYLALNSGLSSQIISETRAAFDDPQNQETFLRRGGSWQRHTIVASMAMDGKVLIHSID